MAQILFNFLSPIRSIAIYIDSIVFGLIDNCFEIIMGFANSEFYKLDIIDDIRKKIYFVITLIAMFRLAFLLINSLINPDKLNDQNEGLSKVAFNFVIMLVLLVVTPMLFNEALDIQETVVTNNLITGIFSDAPVGSTSTSNDYKEVAKDSSRKMKDLVIGSLIYPDPAIADFNESDKKYEKKNNCSGNCEKAVEAYNKMIDPNGEGMKYTVLSKYVGVTEKVDDEEIFVYNYQMFITLICAGFIVYILLSFSFDLAKRFIELNLLMVLSPLFIATYIDPKSAKSGPFNNWLKALGKSYVGLFLRLGALAVMLLFIKIISSEELDTSSLGFIGKIILLFAVLTFCKNIPKWLGDLLGTGDAMGGLGLGKKITDTPLLGGAAKKAGLMATGAVAGAATSAAALGRQRRQLRAQARKDEGLGRVLNGHNKKNYGSYSDLRQARKGAYDKAFEGAGLKRGAAGAIGQGLAGIALGAKAGGTTGIKADNIKGAFKGSVQSSKQGLAGLGVTGGESLGQKIMAGVGIGTAALESQFGTPWQVQERKDKIAADEKARTIAGAGALSGNYKDEEGHTIDFLPENQIPIGKKAQEKFQSHMAECFNSSGNNIKFSDLSPDQALSISKAYTAASFQNGEANIASIKFDKDSGKISIDMKEDSKISSYEFAKGEMSYNGVFQPQGEGAYRTAYYEGQQASLQSYQQYSEAEARLTKSVSDLSSAIAAVPGQLKTSLGDLKINWDGETSSQLRTAIESAKERYNSNSPEDKANRERLDTALQTIALRESQESRLPQVESEAEQVSKKVAELTQVVEAIPGKLSQEKSINVEKELSKAKDMSSKKDDDKK